MQARGKLGRPGSTARKDIASQDAGRSKKRHGKACTRQKSSEELELNGKWTVVAELLGLEDRS